jgi:divalent metal cation (Fe/Co/Zn/Cd) transporter
MRLASPHDDPLGAALQVSWLTVAASAVAGVGAAAVGVLDGSLSLIGLGATVLLDMSSSLVLIWRFRHERTGGVADRHERLAHHVAAGALGVLGALLATQAARNLVGDARPDVTVAGILLASAGLLVNPLLARRKYAAAAAVRSPALRADAHITLVGAAMSAITLAGLLATAAFDWYAADSVAAVVLAAVAVRQGAAGLRDASGSSLET